MRSSRRSTCSFLVSLVVVALASQGFASDEPAQPKRSLQQATLAEPGVDAAAPASAAPASALPERNDNTATTPEQLRRSGPPPKNATIEELETQGDELRYNKAYADALDYYRAAIAKGADNAVLHNKAGMAQLQLLRHSEAKKEFERAIKLDSKYPEAYNNLGVIFYIQRNYGKAARNYQKALKLEENVASFHSNLGTTYFARKEYQKATVEYMRALDLDPEVFERKSREGISARMASPEDRAMYHFVIARMYASHNDAEHCLLYLRKAMEENYAGINQVYKDSEFARLRKDPRFIALMNARPVGLPN